jgi:Photosynthetic reaction centre cytochrome C subunit
MKKLFILFCVIIVGILFSAFTHHSGKQSINQYQDSIEADKAKHVAAVMEMIKGKEKMPVDSVFKNLKIFKGMPAENLIRIMDKGWSRALGVSCGHCHNTTDWASDEKSQKESTRAMAKMNGRINNELLKELPGLKSTNPIVNCTTCHRGQVKPALNLEGK